MENHLQSTVTAYPETVLADGEGYSTVTVELMSSEGTPIGGMADQLSVSFGDSSAYIDADGITEVATGVYMFKVKDLSEEQASVIVTVGDGDEAVTLDDQPVITFLKPDVTSAVSAYPTTLLADAPALRVRALRTVALGCDGSAYLRLRH